MLTAGFFSFLPMSFFYAITETLVRTQHDKGPVKNSSPQHLDLVPSSHRRRRVIFLGLLFLLLLAVGISVIRHPFFPFLFGVSSSQGQSPNAEEENTDTDVMTVAALASEETAIDKFRSGGLGLTRTSWELLHGKPEALGVDSIVYQDSAYKVTYQQDLVWQIEKSWGTTTPALQQARARIRRYLPLDSRLSETIATSDDIFVDVYRSHMLAQLLSPQPAEPPAEKAKRRRKGLPTASC